MIDIKSNFLQLLFERDRLFDIVGMYHDVSLRDVEEIDNLTLEVDSTHDSLKSTHSALQEYEIKIDQLHEKFLRSQSPSYILTVIIIWMIAFIDQRRNLM